MGQPPSEEPHNGNHNGNTASAQAQAQAPPTPTPPTPVRLPSKREPYTGAGARHERYVSSSIPSYILFESNMYSFVGDRSPFVVDLDDVMVESDQTH